MKIDEVLSFYRHKQSNIAKALGVTKSAVSRWYINDSIPYDKQCQLQVITKGKLKASVEDDKFEVRKRENSKVKIVYIHK